MTVALPLDFDDPPAQPLRVTDPYHPDADAETFDLHGYLAQFDARLLQDSAGRRILTRLDPMLFGILYLRKHLRDRRTGDVTFADAHFTWCQEALQWIRPQTEPRAHRHAYVAPRACGKALALDTPVLTANRGWTTHGDLKVGDRVFGPDGQPCNITFTINWDNRPVYEVEFSDGEKIVADANHEWYVHDRYRERSLLRTTAEMADDWLLTERRGFKEVRYSVATCAPLQYPERVLPVAPYLLGLWLGDGTAESGSINQGADDAKHIAEILEADGERVTVSRMPSGHQRDGAWIVRVARPIQDACLRGHPLVRKQVGARFRSAPCRTCIVQWPDLPPATNLSLTGRLRTAGLLNNKHVPEEYFTASEGQRLALIQGLMDSDGHIKSNGNSEFCSTNQALARAVHRLLLTLGVKATVKESRATLYGVDKGARWRITFKTALQTYRLPRKALHVSEATGREGNRRVVNVQKVADRATNCITVDHPTHLYLAGRALVPTHNTTWWFLILPMWAAAHGHARFAAAFADSGTQAELHLATFKRELSDNELLRRDFPDLCEPARRHNGKALAVDTELLTAHRGWTTMADVKPGDRLFHPGGHDVDVLEVMDVQHGRPCYRITTTDRRSVVADAEHLWTVIERGRARTLTTEQLLAAGLSRPRQATVRGQKYTTNEYRFQLPRQEPLKSADVDLPIDPYVLGAWLGDGHSYSAQLTCHQDDAAHWTSTATSAGYVPTVLPERGNVVRIGLTSPGAGGLARSLRGRLGRLGVLMNKHVPEQYLAAGTGQREALLQGLLDTDGTVDARRGQVEFCSTNRRLADAVLYLARSLGWRATLVEHRATLTGRDCGPKYRVCFTPNQQDAHRPFRLARKATRVKATGHAGRFVASIATIEPVDPVPVRCIRVDSPDGLFLAGRDLVATHNTINDSQQMLYTRSGFAFAARGIDSTSLGLKVDEVRPDLLIFDDMEPDESNYSEYQMGKRLSTVQDAILPLNEFARVVVSGTVTMPGSLVHQLVRAGQGEDPEKWIDEERFTIHHTLPIIVRPDGTERSVWPAKWTMEFLNSIRATRSYKKNFANDPMGLGGEYWTEEDFIHAPLPGVTFRVLSVDPAIKTKKRSDFTGLAIVGYAPARRDPSGRLDPLTGRPKVIPSKCVVEFAEEVKLTGKLLRQHILRILVRHPGIQAVMVEQNQGGEHWRSILHDLPCRLVLVDAGKEPKEVRAANAVNYYQAKRVQHAVKLIRLEEQQVAFPRAPHDDMVDAVVAPVIRLLAEKKGGRVAVVRPT